MNLASLKTFLAILETGSLARASARLHVGQSTVTARLQRLEQEIGQSLFHRSKSGVMLTASGLKFKRYAEAMTDLWQQARQEASMPAGISAVFNLGCDHDLWSVFGLRLLGRIHREQPQTALSAWPGKHDELDQWLATGLVDAALTHLPILRDGITQHELYDENLVLVSTEPDSPIRFDPGYIYVDAGGDFGRRHAAAYADAGIARVSFGCSSWALDFLLDRGGSAYLPETIAEPWCDTGQLFRLPQAPTFSRKTYLVTSDAVAGSWPWLAPIVEWLRSVPTAAKAAGSAG